jgi:DNA-nicking Smr family endonuclease
LQKVANEENEDLAAFKKAMKDVRPLKTKPFVSNKPRPAPIPKQSEKDEYDALREMENGELFDLELEYGDEASFRRPEIPRTVMRKLRRGQYSVQSEIDLHGHTAAQAKLALGDFLAFSRQSGYACVRVIHGKGHRSPGKMPVLKPKVIKWLSQRDDIAAFSTARPVDGGTGALYVLLR